MSKVLNLSYTNAIRKINDLSDRLFGGGNIDYQLNEQISMYNAVTYRDESTGLANGVMIGTNGLQNNFGFLNHIFSISDQKFAQVIINIFHEATHCQQKNVMFQNDSPTQNDINQTISELACRGNKTYYMGQHNYIMNPNEIQAEYSGVTEAYQYLCTVFPDIDKKQHEQIILDVLNTKLQSGVSYWIHPSKDNVFTSLSDVEQAFEKAYDESFTKKRTYRINDSYCNDNVTRYVCEHDEARLVYLEQSVGVDQDRVVAAINCRVHPEYQGQYKSLVNVDLSYETNIEKPTQDYLKRKNEARNESRAKQAELRFGHIIDKNKENQSDMDYGG